MIGNKVKKVIVIVGPTASGKSDLALQLAKLAQGKAFKKSGICGAEIISADSRQVYRGMNIGTGKVKKDKKQPLYLFHDRNINTISKNHIKSKNIFISGGVRHHLIDVANPKKQFTADNFRKLGQKAINDIQCRYKVPIIVGGTGFYIDVLLGKVAIAEVLPNPKLRKHFDKLSAEYLFKILRKLDPKRAKTVESKNKRRLIRALEIAMSSRSSQQISKYSKLTSKNAAAQFVVNPKNILWIGLKPADLKQRIKNRLDTRLKQGVVIEVINLRKQGLSWKRLDDFGLEYRWISRWLKIFKFKIPDSRFKDSEEYQNLLRDIVKYSKRQMTWFKRNPDIKWVKSRKEAEKLLQPFL